MIILGIETSCDETACAILKKDKGRVTILSNVVASSLTLQAKYGGVIPEQAAREQLRSIIPVIEEALVQAFSNVIPAKAGIYTNNDLWIPDQVGDDKGRVPEVDAIAVTYGPGLIGSLLVGVETAKTLALVWNKPLIPVNHLIGHFYASWITNQSSAISYQLSDKTKKSDDRRLTTDDYPKFPCLGLLVSGGHTDLVLFTDHGKYKYLGGTRDDASGECFDKCARLLGLPYPGGPAISKLAREGNPKAFNLPRPMIDSDDFDFSFSGLKTAVANLLKEREGTAKSRARKNVVQLSAQQNLRISRQLYGAKQTSNERPGRASGFFSRDELANLAASIEAAIVDVLVEKTIKAVLMYKVDQIMIAGGVAANQKLTSDLKLKVKSKKLKVKLHVPPANLCTDNAAMIAAAAFFNFQPINPLKLQANPNLSL